MMRYERLMKNPVCLSKVFMVALLLVTLVAASGCANHSGSREYIPGKGWVPND
jgi:hypothetical protein